MNLLGAVFGLDILLVDICPKRAWSIDGGNCRDINDVLWSGSLTKVLCSLLGELEDTCKLTLCEDVLVNLLVVQVNLVRVQLFIIILLDILVCWVLNTMMSLEDLLDCALNHP